MIEDMSL